MSSVRMSSVHAFNRCGRYSVSTATPLWSMCRRVSCSLRDRCGIATKDRHRDSACVLVRVRVCATYVTPFLSRNDLSLETASLSLFLSLATTSISLETSSLSQTYLSLKPISLSKQPLSRSKLSLSLKPISLSNLSLSRNGFSLSFSLSQRRLSPSLSKRPLSLSKQALSLKTISLSLSLETTSLPLSKLSLSLSLSLSLETNSTHMKSPHTVIYPISPTRKKERKN